MSLDPASTSIQRLDQYLARIAAIDRSGPTLRAVIELNAEARAQAEAADERRRTNRRKSPVDGWIVLLKDNIATGDGMKTSAGSLALAHAPAAHDAFLVTRLREAGAVILGKTNLSEWANIRSTRSSSGWSARGGLTRNAWVLDRSASGSSSGSAVAVAASLCDVAVGTETDGSIVSPSSVNGIVGLKPTVGLVSRQGVIPISSSQDTAGPMARSVADAAALLGALAGLDAHDSASTNAQVHDYLAACQPGALKGRRIGVVRAAITGSPELVAATEAALETLRHLGAETIDVELPATESYGEAELNVLLTELKVGLAQYLAAYAPRAGVKNLADVIEFNRQHAPAELGEFGQELFEQAQKTNGLTDADYLKARALCLEKSRAAIDAVMAAQRLDALTAPTGDPAWMIDLVNGDRSGASFATPAAVAGYPHLTVPMALVRGLPVALSFVGPANSEALLIGMGYDFEQARGPFPHPAFLPTVPLLSI